MNDAILWCLKRGRTISPVFDVTWKARGCTIAAERFCAPGLGFRESVAQPRISKNGFAVVNWGPSVTSGTLQPSKTTVSIDDMSQETQSFLERYAPKYSEARIRLGSPDLLEEDWDDGFSGLVEGWTQRGTAIGFDLGSDDRMLAAECPKPAIDRTAWSTAPDISIYGTAIPYVLGVHDSHQVSGRGMVAAVPVVWDDLLGYKWLCSGNGLKKIRRVYYDGVQQPDGVHTTEIGVFGSVECTLISCAKAAAPKDFNAVVAFDCEGPDVNGRTAGAVLSNPAQQLRIATLNYVFGDLRYGGYATTHPRIHAASWDALVTLFDSFDSDSGVVIGGHRERQTGTGMFESFLKAHQWVRFYWTPLGQIAAMVVAVRDQAPGNVVMLDTVRPDRLTSGPKAADVWTAVKTSYMYSSLDQQFLASYVAEDRNLADWLGGTPTPMLVENPWSQARFTSD